MSNYTKAQKAAWIRESMYVLSATAYDDIDNPDCDSFQCAKRDYQMLADIYMDYHTEGEDMPILDFERGLSMYEEFIDSLPTHLKSDQAKEDVEPAELIGLQAFIRFKNNRFDQN